MKKKLYKILLSVLSIGTLSTTSTIIASCGNTNLNEARIKKILGDYDFGIAMSPTSTLNYVRTRGSLYKIMPTLVQGLWKDGPATELKNQLQLPKFEYGEVGEDNKIYPGKDHDIKFEIKTSVYSLSDYGLFNANLSAGHSASYVEGPNQRIKAFYANLNGDQNWKGNIDQKYKRPVYAQDYIDYVKYIIDIQTGSENFREVRELRIKGSEDLYQAQVQYQQKFNKTYKYPFGKNVYASDGNIYYTDKGFESSSIIPLTQPASGATSSQIDNFEFDIGGVDPSDSSHILTEQEINSLKEEYWPSMNPTSHLSEEKQFITKIRLAAIKFLTQGMITYSGDSWEEEHSSDWSYDPTTNRWVMKTTTTSSLAAGPEGKIAPKTDPEIPVGETSKSTDNQKKELEFRNSNRLKHLAIHFDDNQQSSPIMFMEQIKILRPVNKDFIDSIGGIYNFGTKIDNFIYSSPFNITDIRLGQGGYIILEKDHNWFSKKTTIPEKIKVYFQEQPNIVSAMFQDGYISAAKIQNVYQNLFWSQKEFRQFLQKEQGVGTMCLQLNIDPSDPNSPLNNEYFRKALGHSINRSDLLKLLNLGASFPVATWTPISLIYTADGRPIDIFMDSQEFTPEFSQTSIPISAITWLEHQNVSALFENVDRTDPRFNVELANRYFEEFKKQTGNSEVTLQFLAYDQPSEAAGMGLRSIMNSVFHGQIKIEIKRLPLSSYQTLVKEGKFDLTTSNFDMYGSQADSYMKHLLFPDTIDLIHNKKDGYENNPTGGWTFYRWFTAKFGEINFTPKLNSLSNQTEIANALAKKNSAQTQVNAKIAEMDSAGAAGNHAIALLKWFEKNELMKKLDEAEKELNKALEKNQIIEIDQLYDYIIQNKPEVIEFAKNSLNMAIDTTNPSVISESNKDIEYLKYILWLVTTKDIIIKDGLSLNNEELQLRFDQIFNLSGPFIKTDDQLFKFIGELEKIIALSVPVIPLNEVDNYWTIKRLYGIANLYTYNLEYAYDVLNKPKATLPGKEALLNG